MATMTILDDDNFESEVLHSELPVLVDLFAQWCGPCQRMKPELEAVADEEGDRLKVALLDTDAYSLITQDYFHFDLLPTCVLFVGGQQVARLEGYHVRNEILWEVEPYLARRPGSSLPLTTSATSEY